MQTTLLPDQGMKYICMMLRASTNFAPAAVFDHDSPIDKTSPEPSHSTATHDPTWSLSQTPAGAEGARTSVAMETWSTVASTCEVAWQASLFNMKWEF